MDIKMIKDLQTILSEVTSDSSEVTFDFLDLSESQQSQFINYINSKYLINLKEKSLYKCVGLIELSSAIEFEIKYGI